MHIRYIRYLVGGASIAQVAPATLVLPYIVPGIRRVLRLLVRLVLLGLRVVLALQLVGHNRRILGAHPGHILGGQARHRGHSAAVRTRGQLAVVVALRRQVVVVRRGIGSGGYGPISRAGWRRQDVAKGAENKSRKRFILPACTFSTLGLVIQVSKPVLHLHIGIGVGHIAAEILPDGRWLPVWLSRRLRCGARRRRRYRSCVGAPVHPDGLRLESESGDCGD